MRRAASEKLVQSHNQQKGQDMKNFPQLKLQEQIDRETRIRRIKEFAADLFGVIALGALLWGALVIGHGLGW